MLLKFLKESRQSVLRRTWDSESSQEELCVIRRGRVWGMGVGKQLK
jgi:hypothetical protein